MKQQFSTLIGKIIAEVYLTNSETGLRTLAAKENIEFAIEKFTKVGKKLGAI